MPGRPDSSSRVVVLFVAVALSLASCDRPARSVPTADGSGFLTPGTTRIDLTHDGVARSYLVHLPPQAAEGTPLPVVVNFHGGGGNAAGHRDYTGMDSAADEAGYVAVYPDGTGRMDEVLLTWNVGTCCGFARENSIDDVGFTRALLADLAARTSIDERRVYATGLSNGAMMAYRLAAEAPDLVAAIAPVAGAMALDPLAAAAPVPVLHFHSLDDPRALYDGGVGPPFPLTTHVVEHNPVESVLAFWAANNGCRPEPTETETRRSAAGPGGVDHTATRLDYGPCRSGADVVHWRLTGAGHVWPGGRQNYLTGVLGPATEVVDANFEMWRFFERFTLNETD